MTDTKLTAVIIEDESGPLQLLESLIIANRHITLAGTTRDPQKAIDLIINLNPDILFLDINMPDKSGFEILDDLKKIKSVNPYIVFTTAFDEFAVRAFEYAAFDYLLKPIDPVRLNDTILRCIDSRNTSRSQNTLILLDSYKKLSFRNISGIVFIDPDDIIFIEASGNYSIFHLTGGKTETVTMLLGKIEEQIDNERFFRISRSALINLDFIKKVNTRQLHCILSANGTEYKCDISRDRIGDLVEKVKL
jgi:two-component system LytT family response regulator